MKTDAKKVNAPTKNRSVVHRTKRTTKEKTPVGAFGVTPKGVAKL